MTISLLQLSQNELRIFNEAEYQQRDIGVRLVDTSNDSLFKDYKSIHDEYLNICEYAAEQSIKVEALKRLIFLNWYFAAEAEYFTGIVELDRATIFSAYKILNSYIKENDLDVEFTWMLTYYSSWEYVILEYSEPELSELSFFVNNADTKELSFQRNSVPKGTMDNRGQMGLYWKPVVEKSI